MMALRSASGPRAAKTLTAEEFSLTSARVLGDCPLPALVLDVPSEKIVAASPAASNLLDPKGRSVIGRALEEFTTDRPASGRELVAGGRLNGFETHRVLRRSRGTDAKVRMWVRTFDHQPSSRLVLVVFVLDQPKQKGRRQDDLPDTPAVMGTADANLLIERISNDAQTLLGRPAAELLGHPLLALIADADVSNCLSALDEASTTQHGVTLYLDIPSGRGASAAGPVGCEVLILPLLPSPSCAFVFVPTPARLSRANVATDLPAILLRLSRGAEIAELARGLFRGVTNDEVPGLNRLTTREFEILARLLDGDRPPAIARRLFLSQSTVRNHLASVFDKLGVSSQQQLLELVRSARSKRVRP
jgi:DNA-binding CsgD family transcriptional regulator